jgi:hypothetical protein
MTPLASAASSLGSPEGVAFVFGTALGLLLLWIEIRWSRRRLEAWARREELAIVSSERRYLWRGPFKDILAQYSVFKVRVRDAGGNERRGWVRLGRRFNAWSSDAEARWD